MGYQGAYLEGFCFRNRENIRLNTALGFPCGSDGEESACSQETSQFLGWEDPLEERLATTPVFLPGESHVPRSLAGYSPQGREELDMTEKQLTHTNVALVPSNKLKSQI